MVTHSRIRLFDPGRAGAAGRDAGELAGRPYGSHDDDFIRLLESGKNVITINGDSHPAHWPADSTERLRAACDTGGTTLMAAGLNPGFIG